MSIPFFYCKETASIRQTIQLDEPTSKHVIQVLRMEVNEPILLTNGKGLRMHSVIIDAHRKRCTVQVNHVEEIAQQTPERIIAMAILKNSSRFEWFLEKATELGINQIIPLITERTEKTAFKEERLQQIVISAMLQSQQAWLPILHAPQSFKQLIEHKWEGKKYIAHCLPDAEKQPLKSLSASNALDPQIVLIGPEGDFSEAEINLAKENNYSAVSLGETRLRTETAGLLGAVFLSNFRN
ncbi:MAG: hypothetical protein RLY16_2177 [Bacteroidota bacterium]